MEGKWKRAEFVDIAKGIAIISVIIGHTWSVYSPMDKRLTIFIYSFHMPLFFIMSGWCLKTTDVEIVPTLIKKSRQLLVPYLVINCIKFLAVGIKTQGKRKFLRALFYASGSNMPKGIDKHSVPMIGMTWFLAALFICQICYLCVKKVSYLACSYGGSVQSGAVLPCIKLLIPELFLWQARYAERIL